MKKIFLLSLVNLFLFLSWSGVEAQEIISDYKVEIKINKDSSLDVREDINYNFGNRERHGVYRIIPITYATAGGNKRTIKIKKVAVKMDEKDVDFSVDKRGENLEIKIGNKYKLISGEHNYTISYRVLGALNYFPEETELYWNVIGPDWDVPIQRVLTKVEAPRIIKEDCFKGEYGSTERCQFEQLSEREAVFNFYSLQPGEEATIVVAVDKEEVIEPSWWRKWQWFLMDNWILFLPLGTLMWAFNRWWNHGRDPKGRGTIIPYYDVPDNLSVAEVSAVLHNSLRSKDISAMIIQLAVKGFIKIKREKVGKVFKHTDYTFYKSEVYKNKNTHLTAEEKTLLKGLFEFGDGNKVSAEDLKNKFYTKVDKIKKQTLDKIKGKKYLSQNTNFNGGVMMTIAVVQVVIFGFLSNLFGSAWAVSGSINFFILVFFAILMGHRTKKGVEIKEKLLGLKMYLETAEKDRIKFHNAPEKNPQRFEKFLPYAMVFGVEKEWAEQFKDIYKEQPEWYEGVGGQTFNSVVLANSLNSFSRTASGSMISAPSSAGSGGSGFSGGGSGGGFGGGGGGSW
jgi:uncharacterized membrane protein